MAGDVNESFGKFVPQYIEALKSKNEEFLKKVYPSEFFQLMGGDPTFNLEMLNPDMIVEEFGSAEPQFECEGDRCTLFGKGGKEGGNAMLFTLVEEQWIGYDVKEAERMMGVKKELEKFKYDYQISFTAFGPAKYEVSLNGSPLEQLADYQNGHSISFVPFTLVPGENMLKITATADPTRGEAGQKTTISYEIYRFPKGNRDEAALFDKNNILVKSGDSSGDLSMEDIQVGPEGFSREVKFTVE